MLLLYVRICVSFKKSEYKTFHYIYEINEVNELPDIAMENGKLKWFCFCLFFKEEAFKSSHH